MKKPLIKRIVSAAVSTLLAAQFCATVYPQKAQAAFLNTDYILYSDEAIVVNMESAVFNGNVFTGDAFEFKGESTCYVNEILNAEKTDGNVQANNKVNAESDKPNYINQLNNTVRYENVYVDATTLNSDKYDLSEDVYSKGKLWIDRVSFSGQGYIRSDGNIQYDAVKNEEDAEVFLYSSKGNITVQGSDLTLNGVIYAPNGKVEINAKNLHVRGAIIAKSIELNGTNLTFDKIIDNEFKLLQFGPEINFNNSENTFKQNRKITLDVSKSFGIDQIDAETIEWKFTAESPENNDSIRIDEATSTNLQKNLIITDVGNYLVTLTAKDKAGKSYTYYEHLSIIEDIAPVASFWKNTDISGRDENGNAAIKLEDTSYSLDGDPIESRIWSVFFDSDNDGDFTDEEEEIFSIGNEKEVVFTADSVGKYMFRLEVAENIHDTILSLIDETAYRKADSMLNTAIDSVVEVTNEAPESYSGIEKAKNIDIVVTVGGADIEDINLLNNNISNIKSDLESKGYTVNLSTVTTSTLTAKDTFAWEEYDHYNYSDWYNQTLDKHIVYEEDSIKMLGYFYAPLRDWLFVDDGINAKRILTFDMVRDKTDWHSMEGGGFLFNTSIKEEKIESANPEEEPKTVKKMNGYCILLTSGGFKLVQLTDIDVEWFRNSGCSSVQSAGKVLTTASFNNTIGGAYDNYNVKIVTSNRLVSVYANDNCIIENFVLPASDTGTGFGPITSHVSHGCSQQSYFTFSNIKMSSINGSELAEELNKNNWHDSAEHYVINLSKNKLVDLNDDASVGSVVESLIENDADFISLGTADSKSQYDMVLKSATGIYADWYDFVKDESIIRNYILNDISGKEYNIKDNTITTSDEIRYVDSFVDKENDPVSDQYWTYNLDASVYENSSSESGVFTYDQPISIFEATGKYSITSKLRDDPTNGNTNLDGYKQWSNEVEWTKSLYVHSKPIAEIKSEIVATADPEKFICTLTFNAYDNDTLSKANKGIKTEKFEWKYVDENEWHEGKVPEIINAEEIYLQKYTVCDESGEWSKPCVELICAEKRANSDVFEDNEYPVLDIVVSDDNPCVDDQISISVSASDNTEIAYTKLMVNGKVVSQYQGTILYDCKNEGELKITAETSDIAHNVTTEEKIVTVTDRRDRTAPVISVDVKNDVVYKDGKLTIIGSISDNAELDNYKVSYAVSGTDEYKDVYEAAEEVADAEIAAFALPEADGKYSVKISAEDSSHNKAYLTINVTITNSTASNSNGGTKNQINKPESRVDTPAEITLKASHDKIEIGEIVTVEANGSDIDGLKTFKIYLDNKLVSENPGQLRFTQIEAMVSTIRVDTTDSYGGKSTKSIEVIFEDNSDKTLPTAEITAPDQSRTLSGKVSIVGSAYDETKLRGYILEYKKNNTNLYTQIASSLNEIKGKELGVWDTTQIANGEYEVRLTAIDNGGNIAYASCVYSVANGNTFTEEEISESLIVFNRPEKNVAADDVLRIEAKTDSKISGGEYQLYIEKSGKESERVIVQNGKIASNGEISADVDTSLYDDGTYIIGIVVQKGDTTAENEVTAVISHGNKAPEGEYICKITSPETMSEITAVSEIKAEASSNIFKKFKMEYSIAGENNYVLFDSGSIDKNEVTGKLDPTMMENGCYDIRFTAIGDGVAAADIITVTIDGSMKIGNFTLSFSDLTVAAAGIPVSVIRTYDSRRKDHNGDFGYGWDMTFDDVKVTISGVQGENWQEEVSAGWVSSYSLSESVKHKIRIDLGNGISEEFGMKISPSKQAFMPITYGISVDYVSLDGKGSTLEPCTSSSELIYSGGYIFDDDGDIYDPQEFIYTRNDGVKYHLSVSSGIKSATYPNGNTITFNNNGISDSSGKLLSYTYDSNNRITQIEASTGEKVSYEYDVFGNLIAFTDVLGNKSTFKYDSRHYLTEIYNADGKMLSKNEYDADGRLVKTTDSAGNAITYSHDIEGREEVITDRNGGVTRYIYDEKGNILSQTDPMNNTVKNTYDSNGNLSSKTDAMGNVTNYSYDSSGNMLELTDAEGNTVTNKYNSKGFVTSINAMGVDIMSVKYDDKGNTSATIDALGNEINYSYDGKGNLKSVTDEIGTYMNMTYDSKGNVITATNGVGTTAEFTYDDKGNCTSKTLSYISEGVATKVTERYTYDAAGNLIETIYSDGTIKTTEYNNIGKVASETDSAGRKTSYKYDVFGNLSQINYPDGTMESFTYDKEGHNLTSTDRLGRKVSMTYDAVGNLLTKTYPNGAVVSYSYDANYNLVSTTSTSGAVTTYEYDKIGRNTAIIDALGNRTSFAYNKNSQLASMTDAKGNVHNYTYDLNGNRIKTTYPDGSSVSSEYDARGRVTSQTDQHGYKTSYTYDGADRLTSVTDAQGNTTSYTYNEVGNLVAVTDANGNTTNYVYDEFSRVTKTTNALGQTAEITYDKCGNVLTSTDYAGKLTTYTYDKVDRVTSKKTDDDTVKYTYTSDGKLYTVRDKTGTTTYTYDGMDGLTKVTYPNGRYVEYTYDDSCRLTSVATAYGTTAYEYDALDRVVKVIDRNGYATVYEYDANGNRSAVRYANGIVVSYEYDKVNRLILEKALDKQGGIAAQYEYTLGAAGERTQVKELDRTVDYTYDSLYRLTGEKITAADGTVTEYTYAYDKVSNRILKTENGAKTVYTYNALNQLVKENDTVYKYDDAGNLISTTSADKSAAYTYNAENKLIRATVQEGSNVSVEEYEYDYAGNRTVKKSENDYTYYLNDLNGELTQVVAELDKDGNEKCFYTRGLEIISQERSSNISYYLTDGHGSVRQLADSESAITDTYVYDAWGNLISSTGDTENSYLYCGEQLDSTTGLYYLRARYMNPTTGTFISMDTYQGTIFDPTSLHKYLYANANPVMNIDPSGYFTLSSLVTCSSISQILSESYGFILLNALKGAIAGAIFGAIDSILGGNNLSQVFKDTITGALWGAALGAAISALACLGVVYSEAILALQISRGVFIVYGGYATYISAKEGNTLQAVFRGILALYSFKSMGKMIKDVKLYNAEHIMYEKAHIGPDFDPKGPNVQEGVNPNSLKPAKDLSTLDSARMRNSIKYAENKPIIVDRQGNVLDGHHRLKYAIDNNKPVDVSIGY